MVDIAYPSIYTVGLSIAYHDVDGWHIQQRMQSGGSLVEIVEGPSVDNAYIITTYLYDSTPSGEIFYGLGPSIDVDISILEEIPVNSDLNLVPVGMGFGVVLVAAIIILWRVKRKDL